MHICQAVHGSTTNHTAEGSTADNTATVVDENAQNENDSEADDDDSEDDDDDIQVTIGDIKPSYELVLMFDLFYSIFIFIFVFYISRERLGIDDIISVLQQNRL